MILIDLRNGIDDRVAYTTNTWVRREIVPRFGTSAVLAHRSMVNHATISSFVIGAQV